METQGLLTGATLEEDRMQDAVLLHLSQSFRVTERRTRQDKLRAWVSGCGTHWDATASMGGCFLRFVLFIYFCLFAFLFYLAGRRFRGQRGITRGWEGNEAGVHNVKLTQNQQELKQRMHVGN